MGLLSPLVPPSADSADNVILNDVVGNKTDTAAGNSIVSLAKINKAAIDVIDAFHDVPTADSADNVVVSDVLGNKTDTHAGNSAYAKLESLEEHVHGLQLCYPTLADSIELTTSASAWTYGSWVEIVPVNTITSDFDVHFINISAISANDEFELQLGSGAGGAESTITNLAFVRDAVQAQEGNQPLMTAIIPANTRIAARIACKAGGAKTCNVKLEYHTY